jgi:ABC-type multidrug transport system ATPase subunit
LNLRVRHLSKAFGSQWALHDINFELHAGDCVALLGQNGAGKTTLLKLLAALLPPTSGAIEFDDARLAGASPQMRALAGYFVPGAHFYEHLTTKENLQLFASLYGMNKNRTDLDGALDRVGLIQWRDRFVSALSAGMKCRLLIAKWLMVEPAFLLLDEPYGPLDGAGVDLLESFVLGLAQRNKTVIIATHQIPRALALCSRALVLQQGQLVFDGGRHEAASKFDGLTDGLLPRGERWRS